MAADAQQLVRRLERMKSRRTVVENTWRDAYRLTYPLRGVGFEAVGSFTSDQGTTNHSTARSNLAELLHTVGTDGSRILASGLQSGLTPANSRWPAMEVGDETDEERRWLDESAESLWENIHASNFDSVSFDCMLDMSIAGMFPMFADEAKDGGFTFSEWSLANTYVSSSRPGEPIDTAFNEFPLTAEQAINTYTTLTSGDFIKVRMLQEGKVGTNWMGFEWVPYERGAKVGNDRYLMAWAKSGVAYGQGADIMTRLSAAVRSPKRSQYEMTESASLK